MSDKNQQSLKEAIQQLVKTYKLEDKLNETKLLNSWEAIMGKTIAKHTRNLAVKKNVLYVTLDSSVLRHELSFAKEKILQLLKNSMGELKITDVVLK